MFTTPIISRVVAVLLLITATLAAYTLLVEPIIARYTETERRVEEARNQLAGLKHAAAMRPVLVKHVKALEEQRESRGYFLTGSTDALAAASLQNQVQALVIEKGGTLLSIESVPGVEEQGLMRITLRVQMTGTTETLFDVLYAFESGNPVLFIDDLDIQNRDSVKAGRDSGREAGSLTVAIDLSGYLPKESQ